MDNFFLARLFCYYWASLAKVILIFSLFKKINAFVYKIINGLFIHYLLQQKSCY